jgi:RNA-binding protein with serine-rich domain 1
MRNRDSSSSSSSYSSSSSSKRSNSSSKEEQKVKEKLVSDITNIFVLLENLSPNVNEVHLNEIFSTYGKIDKIYKHKNKNNARYKISALINYPSLEEAESACKCMNGGQIDGMKIKAELQNLTQKQIDRYLISNKIEQIEEPERKKETGKKSPIKKRHRSRSRSRNYRRRHSSSSSESSSSSSSSISSSDK